MSAGWRCRGSQRYEAWIFLAPGETAEHVQILLPAETAARRQITIARHGLRRTLLDVPATSRVIGNVVTWERPNRSETQLLEVGDLGLAYLEAQLRAGAGEAPIRLYLVPFAARMVSLGAALAALAALAVASARVPACHTGVHLALVALEASAVAVAVAAAFAWRALAPLALHRLSVPAALVLGLGASATAPAAAGPCPPGTNGASSASGSTSSSGATIDSSSPSGTTTTSRSSTTTSSSPGGGTSSGSSSTTTAGGLPSSSRTSGHGSSRKCCYNGVAHDTPVICGDYRPGECLGSTYTGPDGCAKSYCTHGAGGPE